MNFVEYMQNHNRNEASLYFGMSLSAVDRRLKKFGLTKAGWGSKLNLEKARQIRNMYATDKYTQVELSKLFKVSREMINRIVNNKAYIELNDIGLGGGADYKVIFRYQGG